MIILSFLRWYVNTQKFTISDISADILKQFKQNIAKILLIKLLYMTVNVVCDAEST